MLLLGIRLKYIIERGNKKAEKNGFKVEVNLYNTNHTRRKKTWNISGMFDRAIAYQR